MTNNKKVYRLKKGETLWEIAEKELGDATRWREITKRDGGTFTRKEARNLKIGTKVYIPDETTKDINSQSSLSKNNHHNYRIEISTYCRCFYFIYIRKI